MNPVHFPQANCKFGPPPGMDEGQVRTIDAFMGTMQGGNLDGSVYVIVAWKPSPEELEQLNKGALVYLASQGGLAPHFLVTEFPFDG